VDEDDFDLAGFDEAYSPDDFSQADMDFATTVGQQTGGFGDDNTAQEIANYLAQPQLGTSPRSNIVGSSTYDPTFAAALDISRGLDPTNNFGGTGGLAVPSYLRPQTPGNLVLNEAGDRMMYGSPVERFAQETAPEFIRGIQNVGIGSLINRLGTSISEAFSDAKNALGFTGDAAGGLKTEDFTGMMSTRDDQQISGMSQQGAGIAVTDPVVTTPNVAMGSIPQVSPTFDAFGNVTRDANMSRFRDAFGQINAGIANLLPEQNREANIQVADASQFLNPRTISGGLNFLAGPQIQEFFKNVTKNPDTRIRLGPGFDIDKQQIDDNIFSINIPFNIG